MSQKPSLWIQVAVRDSWTKEDAPVQKALSTLRDQLGLKIILEPEWQILWATLESDYADKNDFVPGVARCIEAWCESLCELLDDEANANWSDALLEYAERALRIFVDVRAPPAQYLMMKWSPDRKGFVIYVPRSPMPSKSEMGPIFKKGLLSCFENSDEVQGQDSTSLDNDWADVSVEAVSRDRGVATMAASSAVTDDKPVAILIPEISSILRPDELLLMPPYHLCVTGAGSSIVEVECSHSPTLQLLADYLKKWCKVNHEDIRKPPSVAIKLHQSAFGLGLIYDRLTLQAEGRYTGYTTTPMLVLSIVEGILGYKSVSCDAERRAWIFRRDIEFKTKP